MDLKSASDRLAIIRRTVQHMRDRLGLQSPEHIEEQLDKIDIEAAFAMEEIAPKALFVEVECFTNIDKYSTSTEWPTKLYMPALGQKVQGRRLHAADGVTTPVLQIVAMTHCERKDGTPYLRVELH